MLDASDNEPIDGDDAPDDGVVVVIEFGTSGRLGKYGMLLLVVRNLRGSTTG